MTAIGPQAWNHLRSDSYSSSSVNIDTDHTTSSRSRSGSDDSSILDAIFYDSISTTASLELGLGTSSALMFANPVNNEWKQLIFACNPNPFPVAFKFKTTNPKVYFVSPNCGVLNPGQSINFLAEAIFEEGKSPDPNSKDKILLTTMFYEKRDDQSIQKFWEVSEAEQQEIIVRKRLRCYFDGITAPPTVSTQRAAPTVEKKITSERMNNRDSFQEKSSDMDHEVEKSPQQKKRNIFKRVAMKAARTLQAPLHHEEPESPSVSSKSYPLRSSRSMSVMLPSSNHGPNSPSATAPPPQQNAFPFPAAPEKQHKTHSRAKSLSSQNPSEPEKKSENPASHHPRSHSEAMPQKDHEPSHSSSSSSSAQGAEKAEKAERSSSPQPSLSDHEKKETAAAVKEEPHHFHPHLAVPSFTHAPPSSVPSSPIVAQTPAVVVGRSESDRLVLIENKLLKISEDLEKIQTKKIEPVIQTLSSPPSHLRQEWVMVIMVMFLSFLVGRFL